MPAFFADVDRHLLSTTSLDLVLIAERLIPAPSSPPNVDPDAGLDSLIGAHRWFLRAAEIGELCEMEEDARHYMPTMITLRPKLRALYDDFARL